MEEESAFVSRQSHAILARVFPDATTLRLEACAVNAMTVTHPAMAGSDDEVVAPWGGLSTILETAAERRCDVRAVTSG